MPLKIELTDFSVMIGGDKYHILDVELKYAYWRGIKGDFRFPSGEYPKLQRIMKDGSLHDLIIKMKNKEVVVKSAQFDRINITPGYFELCFTKRHKVCKPL